MYQDFDSDLLLSLKEDMEIFDSMIRQLSEEIISNDISKYPLFIAHQDEIPIGRLVIDKDEIASEWDLSVSHLEEFVNKKIIELPNVENFKKIYKDPAQFYCLFVITDEGSIFIFSPFKS